MTDIENTADDTPPSSRIVYIVLRREPGTDILRATPRPKIFEEIAAACTEAHKRATQYGGTFVVLQVVGGVTAPLRECTATGDDKPVGPVTAAIRASREAADESNEPEPEILNRQGDVVGTFGIMIRRYRKPASKRRTAVPIGAIVVGVHGCRASLSRENGFRDLGSFRTAAEAEAAILAATPLQAHPAGLPPAGSAWH